MAILTLSLLLCTSGKGVFVSASDSPNMGGTKEISRETEESVFVNTDHKNSFPSAEELKRADASTIQKGSLRIHLTDGKAGTSKDGIVFVIYKVAEIQDGSYVLIDSLQSTQLRLDELRTAEELEQAAQKMMKALQVTQDQSNVTNSIKNPDKTSVLRVRTDSEGIALVSTLEIGVYLVYAEHTNQYDNIMPTLVSLPSFQEQTQEMVYDLTLEPKHSPKPTVKPTTSVSSNAFGGSGKAGRAAHQTEDSSMMTAYFATASVIALIFFIRKVHRSR